MRGPRVSLGKDVLWTNTSDVTGVAWNVFDSNLLSWSRVNWLGTSLVTSVAWNIARARVEDGLSFCLI